MDAYLILEDGTAYKGISIGVQKEVISEVVFNTSMTGYLEVMTDPSYAGQAVTMTYPLIGNYGICTEDAESRQPFLDAFIVRSLSRVPSNWRSENTIQNYLKKHEIPGIMGIDTRALTRHLRDHGTMNGILTTKRYSGDELQSVLERVKAYAVKDVLKKVTTPYVYAKSAEGDASAPGYHVALLDLGAKQNIVRSLTRRGCDVTVYPAYTPAEVIFSQHPDGIMLSNGPGDPSDDTEVIAEIRKLYDSEIPIFAICLGHQLMALAMGARTYKLKYGHRGGNHPVKDLRTGRVYITAQNHGYAVDCSSMDPSVAEEAFRNVNDGTNEGLRYFGKKIMTVQFHPEASPGPLDSGYLFDTFIQMMEESHA